MVILKFSKVVFFPYEEDLCVQCMHIRLYADEPVMVEATESWLDKSEGLEEWDNEKRASRETVKKKDDGGGVQKDE